MSEYVTLISYGSYDSFFKDMAAKYCVPFDLVKTVFAEERRLQRGNSDEDNYQTIKRFISRLKAGK